MAHHGGAVWAPSDRRSSRRFVARLLGIEIDPRQIAARPREARDKAEPDWVFGDDEDGGECRGCCLGRERHRRAFRERLVVTVVVVADPGSLPAPRCRLPTPARVAIEPNAADERRRSKGEEAAIMESVETSERKPIMETSERKAIDARCKSWPEREAAGADDSTAESGTAEAAP